MVKFLRITEVLMTITITYHGRDYTVRKYCSIGEFLEQNDPQAMKAGSYPENPIVAGLANNELLPLSARFSHSFTLEEVRLISVLGKRIYRASICFLMAYANYLVNPSKSLVVGHSLGDGYYYTFADGHSATVAEIRALEQKMKEICALKQPITRYFLPYEKARDYFRSRGSEDTVKLLDYTNEPDVECYMTGDFYDLSLEPLAPHTGMLTLWELVPYADGMLLRFPRSSDLKHLRPFFDQPLLFNVFSEYRVWGKILGVMSIGELDEICYDTKKISDYIRLSEALQARKIASIADEIHSRGSKVVLIAGPSSSGKTTFTNKLCMQLKMLGHDALRISLDDYYKPHDQTPVDEEGNLDYDTFEAIDARGFRDELHALLDGQTVTLSAYDFKTGERRPSGRTVRLSSSSVVLVEGIHGLHPELAPQLPAQTVYRIYISALTQINLDSHTRLSTTDNRLLRRLVRDARARATKAVVTMEMWQRVQNSAIKNIFPHQNNADVIMNSALDYEVGVLAGYAIPLLKEIKPTSEAYYNTARRLLKILDRVHPIPAELVPKDSLIREFIGGGEFED